MSDTDEEYIEHASIRRLRQRNEAIKRFQQPNPPTRAAVARDMGVPVSTVSYWSAKAGIPPGSRGRPSKHAEKTSQYRYSVPPSMHAAALGRLSDVGVDKVADLIAGLADGTLRIIRG